MRKLFMAATLSAMVWAGAAWCADETAPLPPIRLNLSASDFRAELDRAHLAGSSIERPIEPRTAVDYRLPSPGLTGQAGYLCGLDGIGPSSEPIPGGPASVYGHNGTFLGAKLAVAIR
jgi:hypothetical protein